MHLPSRMSYSFLPCLKLPAGFLLPRPPGQSLKPLAPTLRLLLLMVASRLEPETPCSNTMPAFAHGCLYHRVGVPPSPAVPWPCRGEEGAAQLLLPLFQALWQLPVLPETLRVAKLVNHVDAEGVLASERDLWINSFRPVFANVSAA